jgi:hypothetical protein
MAEPLERNSLELRMAFHNAVSRFQDWTANVAEPKVRLHGRFRPISEVCEEVANLSNLLPEFIRSILYKETKADDDVFALKLNETYRGAGRHLLRLIEMRKDEIRRRRALKSQPLNHKSGRDDHRFDQRRDLVLASIAGGGRARSHR